MTQRLTTEQEDALLALADRVQAQSGPDSEIDQAIGHLLWQDQTDGEPRNAFDCYQSFTASLDAAKSLIPAGYRIATMGEDGMPAGHPSNFFITLGLREGRFGSSGIRARGTTMENVMVAAALLAMVQQGSMR